MNKSVRLMVVYHILPHYRKGVFDELVKKYPDTVICSDQSENRLAKSIKTYHPKSDFYNLKTVKIFRKLYLLRGIRNVIKQHKPNVMIFLGDMNCLSVWYWGIYCRFFKIKVIFWAHGWLDENEIGLKSELRTLFFKIPDQILLYGMRARKIAVEKGFDPEKVYVVNNSLDINTQNRLRSERENRDSKFELEKAIPDLIVDNGLLLCSSRLTKSKKFKLVLEALSSMEEARRPSILFVGDGEELASLKNFSRKHNINSHFLGDCYAEEELCKYFMAADLLISPGNVGLSAMHAMIYGLPVITHSCKNLQMPEAESVINGFTGFLFEPDDSGSLSQAISRFFRMSIEEKITMRRNCIEIINRFYSPKYQVNKISQAIQSVSEKDPVRECHEIKNHLSE